MRTSVLACPCSLSSVVRRHRTQHASLFVSRMDPQSLSCSFCKRAQQEVKNLVAGPTVFICGACVHSYTENLSQAHERDLHRVDGGRVCSFCGLAATGTRYLDGVEDAAVCNECLRLCNDIVGPPGDNDGV